MPGSGKLVEGRSVRKYTDESAVALVARRAGYADIYKKSLIPLTEMERLMGRTQFAEVLGAYIEKPAGKPTLVPDTDRRRRSTHPLHNKILRRISPMNKQPEPIKVVTGKVRLSYANVWEPKSINGSEPKYSVSIIIPKSDKATVGKINAAIEAAIQAGVGKFGGKLPSKAMLKFLIQQWIQCTQHQANGAG